MARPGTAMLTRTFGISMPRNRLLRRLPALLLLPMLASCGGEDLVLPDDGIPSSIAVVDGNGQSGTIGTALVVTWLSAGTQR